MAHQKPFNYLFVRGGRRAKPSPWFRVLSGWWDDATFSPGGSIEPVTRRTLRLRIERMDRPSPAAWYDISPSTLQAQLSGYVRFGAWSGSQFRVRAHGKGPSKRYSLEIKPLQGVVI